MEARGKQEAPPTSYEESRQARPPHDQDGGTAAEEATVMKVDNVAELVRLERDQRRILVDEECRRLYGVPLDELARGTPGTDYELPEEPT